MNERHAMHVANGHGSMPSVLDLVERQYERAAERNLRRVVLEFQPVGELVAACGRIFASLDRDDDLAEELFERAGTSIQHMADRYGELISHGELSRKIGLLRVLDAIPERSVEAAVLAGESISLDEQLAQWEERKAQETAVKGRLSSMDDVPTSTGWPRS